MKTPVIMVRDFGDLSIRQESKYQFFNATDLLNAYNKAHGEDKRMQNYLDNESTKRYLNALTADESLNSSKESELGDSFITSKRGKFGGTWMHPYLFIDFAMWLSPEFKVTVIRWVYDNLIKLRNECGDTFKEVNETLFENKPNTPPFEYANEARMINKLVFGSSDKGQRNLASEQQLDMLKQLQRLDIGLIKTGKEYFERYEELKKYVILLYPENNL
jgi:hypothetical protein